MQLTQLLDDNEIAADSISYDEKMQAVIALGDVKVSLGSRDNMTDKIAELCAIMDSGELSGLKERFIWKTVVMEVQAPIYLTENSKETVKKRIGTENVTEI